MKIPQQAPSAFEALQSRPDDVLSALGDDRYKKLVRRCEEHYWHWEKVRFVAQADGLDPGLAWAMVKMGRQQRYRGLPLCGTTGGDNLQYLTPDRAQRELMLIDQELAGRFATHEEQPLTSSQRERFIISALREEAIASSMIEGAATTRQDAKKMLKSGRKPRTHGEQMVLNNYKAILFIRENRDLDLSPELLLEIQHTLTKGTLDDPEHSGRFRVPSDDVAVVDARDGEIIHTPPNANELAHRLKTLCEFANAPIETHEFIHPVIKACVLHFQLGFDHPFCDGNGRTARAIFYWSMLRSGYWLFEYLPISRLIFRSPASYARSYLYAETDSFDITHFLIYKLRVISLARQEFREYIARKQAEMAFARKAFANDPSLNYRQRELVLQAARNPDRIFSIEQHRNNQAVAYDTARNDLLSLVDRGYLEKQKSGNRYEFVAGQALKDVGKRLKKKRNIKATL